MNSEKSNNHTNAIIISTTIIASIVLLLIMLIGSSQSLAYAAAEPVKLSNSIFYAPVGNQSFNPTATTSPFGARSVNGGSSWHPAVDYDASVGATDGAAIYPIYEGQIEKKGYVVGETGSFKAGYYVTVRHQIDGKIFYSHYQHMKYACSLGTGTQVHPGDVIGYVGHSGDENNGNNTMGSHLDLRIFEGGSNAWAISEPVNVKEIGDGYAISTTGIKYYDPAKVLNGDCIIPGTEKAIGRPVTISYEQSTYKVIKAGNLKAAPGASAENVGSVKKDDIITIKALVQNKDNNGNMWLETADGKYIFGGLKLNSSTGKYEVDNTQNQHVAFLEDKATITMSGQTFPSGNFTLPISNFGLGGTVESSNTIKSVSGGIYNVSTGALAFGLYKEQTVNGTYYSLAGSAIDNALTFRSITEPGNYEFRFTVNYYTNRMQTTKSKVFKSSFTVGSGSEPTPAPSGNVYKVLTSEGLNIRNNAGISGTIIGLLPQNGTITVTKTAVADGYTWGYGSMSNGKTGWVVISRTDWIQLVSSASVAVTGIGITPENEDKVEIHIGDTLTATVTVYPDNATNKTVTWATSNANVLAISKTYDKYAELIGKGKGQAVITCTTADGGYKASCTITVLKEATGITVTPTSLTLNVGDIYTMKPTVLPSDASNQTVHWYTSDNTIVSILNESKNQIKALKPGTVTITAMSESGGYTADCTVTVVNTIYSVRYDANGGSGAPAAQEKVKGKALTLSSGKPTRDGYTFLGWATSSSATKAQYQPGGSYTQDSSVTLYAVWERNVISVSQITLSETTLTLEAGDTRTLRATVLPANADNPSVTWTTDNSAVATVDNGIVTAIGRGTANITCTANDGSGVSAACVITVNESHTHSPTMVRPVLATRTKNGYSIGFSCACGEIIMPQQRIESDRILSLPRALKRIDTEAFVGANIQQAIIPDALTEIGARAFGNCSNLLIVSIPDGVVSIADDAFAGCNTKYLCIMANDDSYAAQYAERNGLYHCSFIKAFDVIFDANGGECDIAYISAEVGKPLGELPVPAREGCSFVGWYTESGERVSADTVIQECADVHLLAKWRCTIAFDANGGSCATSTKAIDCGDAIGTLPTPTRTYYTFNGWYTASSGGTKVSESTTFAAATTLYAQWTRNTCTIAFNANGGSCSTGSKTMNCGDAIGSLPTATRTYYTFNGWFTASSGGTKVETGTTFAANTTLYAQWTSKGYGSWSGWSTTAYTASSTRQVETKTERVQTGTKTTYSYDRYLYYHPGNGYNMSSYASNWATSQGYSGSWQYLTLDYALTAAGSTDGVAKYSGYYRDGNQYWWHQTVNTEAVYTDVTYYRYRDLIQ